ncbi:MAG: hypothetical protein ABF665_11165 [Gluconacetobacter sp.]
MRATTGDLDAIVERIAIQAKKRARAGTESANEMIVEMADQMAASVNSENAGDFDGAARHSVEAAARAALIAMLVCLFAIHNPSKKVVH